ncbi:hypothetical protein RRG08_019718 [Elysia crispata]|uniref:Uncharacterized protein n=1 Tax=Elysia crispata TaxID=231223 RepID=A0AAE1AAA9_9GAST|nr:hypothetical protein RRG08_019718 [Elysia crispata]
MRFNIKFGISGSQRQTDHYQAKKNNKKGSRGKMKLSSHPIARLCRPGFNRRKPAPRSIVILYSSCFVYESTSRKLV